MRMNIDRLDSLPFSLKPQKKLFVDGCERALLKSSPSHREIEAVIKSLRDPILPVLIIPRAVHMIGYPMINEIAIILVFLFQEPNPL